MSFWSIACTKWRLVCTRLCRFICPSFALAIVNIYVEYYFNCTTRDGLLLEAPDCLNSYPMNVRLLRPDSNRQKCNNMTRYSIIGNWNSQACHWYHQFSPAMLIALCSLLIVRHRMACLTCQAFTDMFCKDNASLAPYWTQFSHACEGCGRILHILRMWRIRHEFYMNQFFTCVWDMLRFFTLF